MGVHGRFLVTIVAAFGLILAGCAAPAADTSPTPTPGADVETPAASLEPTTEPTPEPLQEVNIRFSFSANGQYAPFYAALDQGYYEEAGLDVTLDEGTGGTQVIQTVAAGEDFLVTPGLDILITARSQGAPLKAIATLQQDTPAGIGVLSTSGIERPEDLAGKRILTSVGGTSFTLFEPYLRAVGVAPDSIELITTEGRSKVPSLLAGEADGATVFGNDDFLRILEQDPDALFLPYSEVLGMYGIGMVVHEDSIANNRDIVERLVHATLRGYQYAIDNPEETVDAMFQYVEVVGTPESHVERLLASLALFEDTEQNGCVGCMTEDRFAEMEELTAEFGALDRPAGSMSEYFTNEFVESAP